MELMTIMRAGVRTNSPESPSHAYPHSWLFGDVERAQNTFVP